MRGDTDSAGRAEKYGANPEVWRSGLGRGATLQLAGLMWLIVPVPLIITNALFIKIHPLIIVSHSLSWLAKLIVAAYRRVRFSLHRRSSRRRFFVRAPICA